MEQTLKELKPIAAQIAQLYKEKIQQANSVATGNLLNFTYDVTFEGTVFRLIFNLPKEWAYVENGRAAGKFPPIEAIKDWIQVKKIVPYPDSYGRVPTTNQLAYLISRKIATDGIQPKPLLQETIDQSARYIDSWNETIKSHFAQEINTELINIQKEINEVIWKQ